MPATTKYTHVMTDGFALATERTARQCSGTAEELETNDISYNTPFARVGLKRFLGGKGPSPAAMRAEFVRSPATLVGDAARLCMASIMLT